MSVVPSHQIPEPPAHDQLPPPTTQSRRPFVTRNRRRLLLAIGISAVVVGAAIYHAVSTADDQNAKPGDCLSGTVGNDSTVQGNEIIDCGRPHTREVYAVGSTTTFVSLTGHPLDPELARICVTEVDPKIVEILHSHDVYIGYIISTNRTGRVICVAITPERTGSYVALTR